MISKPPPFTPHNKKEPISANLCCGRQHTICGRRLLLLQSLDMELSSENRRTTLRSRDLTKGENCEL
ncbi:hypothetical protein CEXT_179541 [Caerostris extrusa]|uniref:Uncharacterized protein n=1 Tax=Caerostris extrusa TaxID=172846 RepID=A0AAV4WTT0_CAEEX|nr:hypothetical protein CEXT_179541 [Caerostris extrusa]